MMIRPEAGGAGRCAGRHCDGCAAATAVLYRRSRKAREEAVKGRRSLLSVRYGDCPRAGGSVTCCKGSRAGHWHALRCAIILTLILGLDPWEIVAMDEKTRTELEAA